MPATEQTWRNTKWLHLVFGLTSLAMLLVTLWMFADDHNREWKNYQQTFYNEIEVWNLRARQNEQQNVQFEAAGATRQQEIEEQKKSVPDKTLIDLFALEQRYQYNLLWLEPEDDSAESDHAVAYANLLNKAQELLKLESSRAALAVDLDLAQADAEKAVDAERKSGLEARAKQLQAALTAKTTETEATRKRIAEEIAAFEKTIRSVPGKDGKPLFVEAPPAERIEASFARLKEAEGTDDVADQRKELLATIDEQIKVARFEEEKAQQAMKFERADLDVVRSDFGLRLGEGAKVREVVELQEDVEKVAKPVREKEERYARTNRHRKQLDAVLAAVTAGDATAEKAKEQHEADVKRLQEQGDQASSGIGKSFLSWPIIDAFNNSPLITLKGVDIWLPRLTIDRNFNKVARFDRCGACHAGILKSCARATRFSRPTSGETPTAWPSNCLRPSAWSRAPKRSTSSAAKGTSNCPAAFEMVRWPTSSA